MITGLVTGGDEYKCTFALLLRAVPAVHCSVVPPRPRAAEGCIALASAIHLFLSNPPCSYCLTRLRQKLQYGHRVALVVDGRDPRSRARSRRQSSYADPTPRLAQLTVSRTRRSRWTPYLLPFHSPRQSPPGRDEQDLATLSTHLQTHQHSQLCHITYRLLARAPRSLTNLPPHS